MKNLISGDDQTEDGSTVWPKEFFQQVIEFTKKNEAQVNGSAIRFAPGLDDLHNWKVAGIRVNPASLGGSDGMIAGIQGMLAHGVPLGITGPVVPGIRLVMQPVTVTGDQVKIHDYAAHVVFNQAGVVDGAALAKSAKMQSIVGDLVKLKNMAKTDGVELGVHPGFKVPGFRDELGNFLKRQLSKADFDVVSFMGLANPGFEPWIFFRVRREKTTETMVKTPIGGFLPLPPPAPPAPTSIMLAVLKNPVVQPTPKALEKTPIGAIGLATAPLLRPELTANDPVLNDPLLPGATGEFKDIKLSDIPDFVANPERANTLNTDCISCHTETTRRLKLGLVKKPSDPPGFQYQRQDKSISDVSPSMAPGTDDHNIPWNVRIFGWSFQGKPTISQRGANEAMESADFFNRVFFNKP